MFIAYLVAAILLAAVLAVSARGKVTGDQRVTATLVTVGVPQNWYRYLAGCEAAGALGLLVGLAVPAIGIAAAAGVVLYFVGAAIAHLRAHDGKGLSPPLSLLTIALAALVLRITSM
jgi:hypothetical protein